MYFLVGDPGVFQDPPIELEAVLSESINWFETSIIKAWKKQSWKIR